MNRYTDEELKAIRLKDYVRYRDIMARRESAKRNAEKKRNKIDNWRENRLKRKEVNHEKGTCQDYHV